MWLQSPITVAASMILAQHSVAAQPIIDPKALAHTYDRCMAEQAVELALTGATDRQIFGYATMVCLKWRKRLVDLLQTQVSSGETAGILTTMDRQAKPKFMLVLSEIRNQAGDATAPASQLAATAR